MPKKLDISLTLICILLGFIIAVQIRSVVVNSMTQTVENFRVDQVQALLQEEQAKNEQLTKQVNEYRKSLEQYRDEASKSGDYAKVLADQLQKAEILAGMTEVEGPGVIVTLTESRRITSDNPMNDVIHDDDILRIINELCGAGAEALAVNDERILSTSEIRCAGATINVNNTRYAAPFVIKAIGDAQTLESALTMRYGLVEVLNSWGIDVEVVKSNRIRINAYTGAVGFAYAGAVQEGR